MDPNRTDFNRSPREFLVRQKIKLVVKRNEEDPIEPIYTSDLSRSIFAPRMEWKSIEDRRQLDLSR